MIINICSFQDVFIRISWVAELSAFYVNQNYSGMSNSTLEKRLSKLNVNTVQENDNLNVMHMHHIYSF